MSSKQAIQQFLQSHIQVHISDGRVFVGMFAGTDKPLNLLLVNAEEYTPHSTLKADGQQPRYVGHIMIPWKLVLSVQAEKPEPIDSAAQYL